MLEAFLKQAIPEPATCLGVRLLPFSRGHYWLLKWKKSPYLGRGKAGLRDLLFAVLICSRTYHGAIETLADPDLGRDLDAWQARIRGNWFRRRFRNGSASATIERAARIMRGHIERGLAEPYVRFKPSTEEIGSDWSMLSVAQSMEVFGQTFEHAINEYAPLARWLLASYGEGQGTITICDAGTVENLQAEADEIARQFKETGNL